MRYVYLISKYTETFLWSPPDYRFLSECEIGEYPERIGLCQPFRTQVSSNGLEAVQIAVSRVWKFIGMVKVEYHTVRI